MVKLYKLASVLFLFPSLYMMNTESYPKNLTVVSQLLRDQKVPGNYLPKKQKVHFFIPLIESPYFKMQTIFILLGNSTGSHI